MDNYFNTLNAINVGEHTEDKNGLTYLSWAWAWAGIKKLFPDTTYTIYENKDGLFYHTDGKTAWVKTGVTCCGLEHIEFLPVMDNRNRSIPLANITSTDVNKAIQRSLTKAVARHGLGLYVYAGEDLPEDEDKKPEKPEPGRKPEPESKPETEFVCPLCKRKITPLKDPAGKEIGVRQWANFTEKHVGQTLCLSCMNKHYPTWHEQWGKELE